MSTPLIVLDSVSKTFDEDRAVGLRDASLTIHRGEFVAVVGPSGAGKSTLLNILGLLDVPDSGSYFFDGRDALSLGERELDLVRGQRVGFVFQSSHVLGEEPALVNAALGLRILGVPLATRTSRAIRVLEQVGIRPRWSVKSKLLSGGERQRLAIARAIAAEPDLILADEPTGNLDSKNSEEILKLLGKLNAGGTTVVVITHDERVASVASRRVSLLDGRIVEQGAAKAVLPSTETKLGLRGARRVAVPFLDDLGEATSAALSRPFRSFLLMIAFALGVGGLIAAIGLGETAASQVSERLTQAALDEVNVTVPGGAELLAPDNSQLAAWMQTVEQIPHVVDVAFVATAPATSNPVRRMGPTSPAPSQELFLLTASANFFELQGVDNGQRWAPLSLLDLPPIGQSAWLGVDAMRSLDAAAPGPGSLIWIAGRPVTVVGIVGPSESSIGLSGSVVVSRDVVALSDQVGVRLVVRTEQGFPAAVAEAIPLALDPASPARFPVETVADLREIRFGVANDLGVLVGGLSLVLLIVAIISASATMFLSVQARAPEIALRRALGASRSGVARLFVVEGVLMGLVGGSVGALFGTIGVFSASAFQGWVPVLPASIAPFGVVLGIVTGLLSAIVPAILASRQRPADAIRG